MSLFNRKIKYKPIPVSADQFFISDSENENAGAGGLGSNGAIYIYTW